MNASKELLAALGGEQVRPLNGLCTAVVRNALDPSWGVVIVSAAVQFFYKDGSSDIDSEQNINIGGGGAKTFRSRDATKCVVRCHFAGVISQPGQGNQLMETDHQGAPGQCALEVEFTLSPKRSIPEAQFVNLKLEDRVEIKKG